MIKTKELKLFGKNAEPKASGKKNLGKRGQILSLDLMSSLILFTLLIILFVGFFVFSRTFEGQKTYDYEFDYIFRNLEVNLNDASVTHDFLSGTRVNAEELGAFAREHVSDSVDEYIIGNLPSTKGIGLDSGAYDLCFYFTNEGSIYNMNYDPNNAPPNPNIEIKYLGVLRTGESCAAAIAAGKNPCEGYKEAVSIFKPVLLDFEDYTKNKVIQMNVVICQI